MSIKNKRIITLIVTISMLLTVFSTMASGSTHASQEQITSSGSTKYYNSAGKEVTSKPVLGSNADVAVAKTIKGTDVENEFVIDLEVKTTSNTFTVSKAEDEAVILVLDLSTSMGGYLNGIRKAANDFLSSFVSDAGGSARYVALIVFGSNAMIRKGWTDVTNAQNLAAMQKEIEATNNSNLGNTYVQGALMLARNLLRTDAIAAGTGGKTIESPAVILFTDGEANCYSDAYFSDSYSVSESSDVTAFTAYSDGVDISKANKNAETMANEIKNSTSFNGTDYRGKSFSHNKYKAKIFTVTYPVNLDNPSKKEQYIIWMRDKISSGSSYAYSATDATQLSTAFKSVAEQFVTKADAVKVTDPMGDYIEFISTISNADKNSGLYKFENNTLTWDLTKDEPKQVKDGIYTYSYSYKIRLDTTANGYIPNTAYKTNGETKLAYYMTTNGSQTSEVFTAKFDVPAVKGFKNGSFGFAKVGDNSLPLPECNFTLVNKSKATHTFTAKSQTGTGAVSFSDLPSGHTYTLSETSMASQYNGTYRQSSERYTVTVSYGEVIIKDSKGTAVTGNFKFNNPLYGRKLTGLVSPYVWKDMGVAGFLKMHEITVELRPTFQTPAESALKTVAVLETSSTNLGRFTINDVPVGTYVLFIKRAGYLTRSMMVTVSPTDADVIELKPPGTADNGVFNLWQGDINDDYVVDASDISYVVAFKNVSADDARYFAACDFNADGVINGSDIALATANRNKTAKDYAGADQVDFGS